MCEGICGGGGSGGDRVEGYLLWLDEAWSLQRVKPLHHQRVTRDDDKILGKIMSLQDRYS